MNSRLFLPLIKPIRYQRISCLEHKQSSSSVSCPFHETSFAQKEEKYNDTRYVGLLWTCDYMVNMPPGKAKDDQRRALQRFQEALEDLTFNSKPLIDDLTRAAESCKAHAPKIVEIIESRLMQVDESHHAESLA